MEGVIGGNTVEPNSIDKSKVLDVKPVRTLVPIFPDPSEGPPFICVPPNGPFPSGFPSFFPFSGSIPNQNVTNPTAARPVTTEPSNGDAHGENPPQPRPPVKKRGRGRPRTRFP